MRVGSAQQVQLRLRGGPGRDPQLHRGDTAVAGGGIGGAQGEHPHPVGEAARADFVDGAVARHDRLSDLGGYLDIVCDFLIYAGIPVGFALMDPQANALAAAVLLFSFMGTGSSFLTYAIIAAKRGETTEIRGRKSLYYLGGLTEGTETFAFLAAICAFPQAFVPLAYLFAVACWITTVSRMLAAVRAFGDRG